MTLLRKKIISAAAVVLGIGICAAAAAILHPHKATANICFSDGCISILPVCGAGATNPLMSTQEAMNACINRAWGVSPGECCRVINVIKDADGIIDSAWIGCSNGWGTWMTATYGGCTSDSIGQGCTTQGTKSVCETVTTTESSCDDSGCYEYPYTHQVCHNESIDICGAVVCDGSCSPYTPQRLPGSCSRSNDCGQSSGGTTCDGGNTCTANPPPNPSWYGQSCSSGANECGQRNVGSYGCSHTCSVGDPSNSQCPPPTISTGGSVTSPTGTSKINTGGSQTPTIVVNQGATATLTWSATPANACSVTSNAGFSQSTGGSGSITTPPVVGNTVYTITCWTQGAHGTGPSASTAIRVIPNPGFREI